MMRATRNGLHATFAALATLAVSRRQTNILLIVREHTHLHTTKILRFIHRVGLRMSYPVCYTIHIMINEYQARLLMEAVAKGIKLTQWEEEQLAIFLATH